MQNEPNVEAPLPLTGELRPWKRGQALTASRLVRFIPHTPETRALCVVGAELQVTRGQLVYSVRVDRIYPAKVEREETWLSTRGDRKRYRTKPARKIPELIAVRIIAVEPVRS